MGQFSFWHLIMVLGIVLIFFGPSRLPSLGQSLGRAIRGFKDGMKGLDEELNDETAKPSQPNREALTATGNQAANQAPQADHEPVSSARNVTPSPGRDVHSS
jgi:sec-independent protein translocase protein TatA